MVSDSEVFQVHGQPRPVSVECMSQSELFQGVYSLYALLIRWSIEFVACVYIAWLNHL